jgi:hypothetical protein
MCDTEDLGPQEKCGACKINLLKFNHAYGRFAFKGKGCPQCGIEICSPEEKNPAQAKAFFDKWVANDKPIFNKDLIKKMKNEKKQTGDGYFKRMVAHTEQFT